MQKTAPTIVSTDLLAEQLFEMLKDISLEDFVGLLTTEYSEILQFYDLSRGQSGCMRMSLLFNPHRLATRTKGSRASIYEALKHKWFSKGLARATLFRKETRKNELLYQVLQLGINGVQYLNEFPPLIAAKMYRRYLKDIPKGEAKVLDPCAGWGGRMIGAATVVNQYDCFEPASKTYEGLVKLAGYIKDRKLNPLFEAKVHCTPFEDAFLREAYYDFALTSPPYYDTELYSDEETNSCNRYSTFEDWCEGFYFPLIQKTMGALKPGGTFILNIGDKRYPLSRTLLEKFGGVYNITKLKSSLSQSGGGIGRGDNKGEAFYAINIGPQQDPVKVVRFF